MNGELHAGLRPRRERVRGAGVELSCLVWGDDAAPSVLLVHGNGGHARWWDPLVPYLVPGWRLVVPDLRGHGESAWAEPPRYLLEDFARDLVAVADALAPGRIPLVGHSMGGRVAVAVAAERPERVAALAVLDSRFDPIDPAFAAKYRKTNVGKREGRGYSTREDAIAAFRFIPHEPDVDPRITAHLAAHAVCERRPGDWTFRFDRGVLSLEGDGAGDLRERIPRIRCPVFVGAGSQSWVMPPREIEWVQSVLPQVETHVFPGAHHFLVRCPERLGPVLRRFLDATTERR
ncbi:MAG TPA: alpha/beta hydrolase [Candidatus Limnocylindria bacterium]|nr:alpha/beta hydrolase [Candidatus Limnocylindria bacterium]